MATSNIPIKKTQSLAASHILIMDATIQGTRPLLFHRFGPEALPLERQERTGVAGHDPEEWRRTAIVDKSGQLFLPPTYAFSTAKNGAVYTKSGKSSLLKPVAATLQILSDRIMIDRYFPGFPSAEKEFDIKTVEPPSEDIDQPVYLDIQGVVNPSTKSRNVRYRIAASKGWQATFSMMFDKTIIAKDQMHAVLIDAGKLVGIGNGRSVGYGRFDVVSFTEAAA